MFMKFQMGIRQKAVLVLSIENFICILRFHEWVEFKVTFLINLIEEMSNSPDNQALCAFLDAVSQVDSETRRKSMQADNLKNL